MTKRETWLITGCGAGLGRALAARLAGEAVNLIATARDAASLGGFAGHGAHVHATQLDVTRPDDVARVVREAGQRFGGVDVLVNNATGRLHGPIEEVPPEECRALFETNLFGMLELTRAVLPGMRAARAGTIVNTSSLGGLAAQPGLGHYSASKFAVEGISEALALECAPFGVRVIVAVPTSVRTGWAGATAEAGRGSIADYDSTAGHTRRLLAGRAGRQPGDPDRAAQAIVDAVRSDDPPFRLFLGDQGLQRIRDKLARVEADLARWRDIAFADRPT